jgi:hypothetical protein
MHEESRGEHRTVKQLFDGRAKLVERGPMSAGSGSVEIHVDRQAHRGPTFRAALCDALAFVSGGALVRASSIVGRGEQC